MCPYDTREKRFDWERANRPGRWEAMKAATAWADRQIATLKDMGIIHTKVEWALLRAELRRDFIVHPPTTA